MIFDIYGKFRLEVIREGDTWSVYRITDGKRLKVNEPIPPSLTPEAIGEYLDDLYHEAARPGQTVRQIET